ncbi:hypothetical protein Tco_0714989 [Tanacetum coccineum]
MFDEYLNPPPSVASLVPAVVALVPADSTGLPSSSLVDQDAQSPSKSQTPHVTPRQGRNARRNTIGIITTH